MGVDQLPLLAARHFRLGELAAPPAPVAAGSNHVWKVVTHRGQFAVHELLGTAEDALVAARCQRIFALERCAREAGVVLPAPVLGADGLASALLLPGRGRVQGHEWVDAQPVRPQSAGPSFYGQVGGYLAVLHGLKLSAAPPPSGQMEARLDRDHWADLADAGRRGGWPWADELAQHAGRLAELAVVIGGWRSCVPGPDVFSHRDLTLDNILDRHGVPVLIDWESAGPIGPGDELGRTALDNLWQDGALDVELLTAYLAGYRALAALPPVGRDWCATWCLGLLVLAEHCAARCAAHGGDPADLAFQSRVVADVWAEAERRVAMVDELVAIFASTAAAMVTATTAATATVTAATATVTASAATAGAATTATGGRSPG